VVAVILLAVVIILQILIADADLTYCSETLEEVFFDDVLSVLLPFIPLACLFIYALKYSQTSPALGLWGILLWGLYMVLSILRIFDEARGFITAGLSTYEKITAAAVVAACISAAVAFITGRGARLPATLFTAIAVFMFGLGLVWCALSDSYYFLTGYQMFVQYGKFVDYMLVLIATAVMYWSPERVG